MQQWVREDLKRSGINAAAAKKLKLKEESDGYIFPYFDIDGSLLEIGEGFAKRKFSRKKLKEPKGKQKYVQAKHTGCHLYLPPVLDWVKIANSEDEIWITEGEKKSICACVNGLPCIGLSGVFNWLERDGVIPELENFPLDHRQISIVFDADYRSNPQVMDALVRLYRYLESRHCEVFVADLPDETKGLDDFIVAYGADEAVELLRGDELYSNFDIDQVSGFNEFQKFNERFVLVRSSGKYIDLNDDHFVPMNRQTFIDVTSHIKAYVEVTDKRRKGGIALKEIPLAQKWLAEGEKRTVDEIGYAPIDKKILRHDGALIYNTYTPSDVIPVEGDISIFEDHLKYLFEGREKSVEYLMDLIAFKTQNPMIKPRVFVLIVSPDTYQIGKSAIKSVCATCFGESNIGAASQSDFSRTGVVYNEFMVNTLAFFVDEIYGIGRGGAKEVKELVKTWATENRVSFNIKYGGKGKTNNYAIPFFFSNHIDSIKIDSNDARAFVEITSKERKSQDYYNKLFSWLDSAEGKSAVMHHFMSRDISHFDPMDIPKNTESKALLVEENMTPMALFIKHNIMGESVEHEGYRKLPDVMYIAHIRSMLQRVDELCGKNDEIDNQDLGYALKEAGAVHVKLPVRSRVLKGNEGIMRLCIIRNFNRYDKVFLDVKGDRTKWRGVLRDEADKAFGNANIVGKLTYTKLKQEAKKRKSNSSWNPKIVK